MVKIRQGRICKTNQVMHEVVNPSPKPLEPNGTKVASIPEAADAAVSVTSSVPCGAAGVVDGSSAGAVLRVVVLMLLRMLLLHMFTVYELTFEPMRANTVMRAIRMRVFTIVLIVVKHIHISIVMMMIDMLLRLSLQNLCPVDLDPNDGHC